MITMFNDKSPSLEELQKFVGGYIEVINLPNDVQMIVNEEEKLLSEYIINFQASILAKQIIVGNVVLLTGPAKLK